MRFSLQLTAVTVLVLLAVLSSEARRARSLRRAKRHNAPCGPATMVRYQMTIHTRWNKLIFPKMFPTYRPHAQWSALIGRTHGEAFSMWTLGENATSGVMLFAEKGETSELNREAIQGYNDVLDTFVSPAIGRGVGETSAVVLMDGEHSKLSFMMKIIPSPDWFIGVSGLDMCDQGQWKKKLNINLPPMDAGTDQGLTFTAPNWPNVPAVPISVITSSKPDREASSFYYPELEELPVLAYMELELVSLSKVRRTFMEVPKVWNIVEETTTVTTTGTSSAQPTPRAEGDDSDGDVGTDEDVEDVSSTQSYDPSSTEQNVADKNTDDRKGESYPPQKMKDAEGPKDKGKDANADMPADAAHGHRSFFLLREQSPKTRPDGEPIKDTSPESYKEPMFPEVVPAQMSKYYDNNMVDCVVTEWGEWSACSKTCGFGSRLRARDVVTLPQNGGINCPRLKQEELCGSMRNCQWGHFGILGPQQETTTRRIRRRRRRD